MKGLLFVALALGAAIVVYGSNCSCPRGKDYFAYHHPNAHTTARTVDWPASVPRVLGCGGGSYTVQTLLALSDDAYVELLQEYVTAHLNNAVCETSAVDDILAKAEVLIATYCNTETITPAINPTDYTEAREKTFLLRAYNEGYEPREECVGTQPGGIDEHCDGGCTATAQFYYDINCHSGGTAGQTNCPNNWPSTFRETDFICGSETYLDALVHRHTDPWYALAAEYITANLNRARNGACRTSEVIEALKSAKEILDSQCNCSPGQTGCVHAPPSLFPQAENPLSVLEKYNQGILGPGTCGIVAEEPAPSLEAGCRGGCAHTVEHWVTHSCVLPVVVDSPAPNNRVAWPGSADRLCSTIPNQEDTTLCGESWYGIMARYARGNSQDAWTNMAAEYIGVKLNQANGACINASGALTATSLTSVVDLLESAKTQLEATCGFANDTALTSTLGTSMYLKQLLLQSFNEGELGPSRCVQETSRLCHDSDSCTLSSEYWKTHNRFAEAPRNQPWPIIPAQPALRINPKILAAGSGSGTESINWCPGRPETNMLALFDARPTTVAQTRWLGAMNQLTTTLLNGQLPSALDKLLESMFVDRCLIRPCQMNPEDTVPSLPDYCITGYETFYTTLAAFNQGLYETAPHCGRTEAPDGACGSLSKCGCTYDKAYYTTPYSSWPRPDSTMYPLPESWPGRLEEFTSLVCPKEGGWQSILRKRATGSDDVYFTVMHRIIMAWLHVFSSEGCISADLLQVLQQATTHVSNILFCTSNGVHAPINQRTLDGRMLTAYADALAPYTEASTCQDPCKDVSCGDWGICNPADKTCLCDPGWKGEWCDRKQCSGRGIDDGSGTCHCFPGFAGSDCDTCGAPLAVSGKSYICRPCPPDTCGFAMGIEDGISVEGGDPEDAVVFLLTHVPSASLSDYIHGTVRFPDSKGLPLPRRAGDGILDCDCKYTSERHFRASSEGSLVRHQSRIRNHRRGGNVYYDSRLRTAPGAVLAKRHETNISDPAYDDVIDAIDALYYSLIGSEELSELCSVEINLTCPEPVVSNEELEDQAEREHDRITGFGIAITVIVSVILLGLVILTVVLCLMWNGVPIRGNPFAANRRRTVTSSTIGKQKVRRRTSTPFTRNFGGNEMRSRGV
jgi:hypothetical protein